MIERAAIAADLGIKAPAHMLRHACGYKLANDGHDPRAIQAFSGIATFRIRRGIRPWRHSGSGNFFEIDALR
jgi:integrase